MGGGAEPRLRGRLAPARMFPAGVDAIRVRRVALANGIQLRVAESGDAQAPAVLLLHGWGASLYMWRDWFEPLANAGCRVIAIDLPGHGLSDKPADPAMYRLDAMTQVVLDFISSEGLRDVAVVAQSMAGTIVVEAALATGSPIGRTVLVNPACFGRVRMQRLAALLSRHPIVDAILPRLVVRSLVARTHRMVYGDPSRLTRRDEDEYWAPSQFPSFARAMRRLVHEFQWRRPPAAELATRLRTLRVPMLLILGSRDVLVRGAPEYVEALRASGAPLEVLMIEGGGHAVNEERPEEVLPPVLRFLERTT